MPPDAALDIKNLSAAIYGASPEEYGGGRCRPPAVAAATGRRFWGEEEARWINPCPEEGLRGRKKKEVRWARPSSTNDGPDDEQELNAEILHFLRS